MRYSRLVSFAGLVINFRFGLHDGAGGRVDVVVVFHAARLEVDVVMHDSVIGIEVDIKLGALRFGYAGVFQSDFLCSLFTDVGRCARCC